MLLTEMATTQIPNVYREFSEFVGESHWRNRVKQLREEIRGNQFLKDFLHQENSIAYQLEHLAEVKNRYGGIPAAVTTNRQIYPAVSFAAQVLSIAQASSRPLAEKLRRRIHDSFKKPEAMRALRLELATATHFARRARRLTWPEMTGEATFDLLVDDLGPDGLEVECKSIGEDKGRKIHQREALDFYGLLWPHIQSTARDLRTGLSAVLTLSGRLPERHKDRVQLAREFARAILAGTDSFLDDGSLVQMKEFDPTVLGTIPNGMPHEAARDAIDEVSETQNRQAMVIGGESGGALALTLQSAKDDAFMKAVFDTLSDSARRQFSGRRGGMFIVGLHGISGGQLLSVAQHDHEHAGSPSALRLAVSRFLNGQGRDHVVGVGFVSEGELNPKHSGLVETAGTSYYFPKRESPMWSEDFSSLFAWSSHASPSNSTGAQ